MSWKLKQIEPVDLHQWWPIVRSAIEEVREISHASYWLEDCYAAVQCGRAQMHIGEVDGEYAGVLLLSVNIDPFSAEKSLLVWIAWGKHPLCVPSALQDVYRIAAQMKLTKIKFHTVRGGWERRLRDEGFRLSEMIFEKDLNDGNDQHRAGIGNSPHDSGASGITEKEAAQALVGINGKAQA